MKKMIILSIIFILIISCKQTKNDVSKNSISNSDFKELIDSIENNSLSNQQRIYKANKFVSLSKLTSNDSVIFNAFTKKLSILQDFKMDDQIFKESHKLINWSKKISNKKYLGNSYFNLANYYYEKYSTDSAYYYFNLSKNEFLNLKDKEGIAKNNINIAMILNDVASYFESEKLLLEALNQIKDQKNHPYLTPIYNNLAVSSGGLLNYNEELYWYKKALELTKDEYYTISIKHNQAVALTLLKKYREAIVILNEIINDPILKSELSLKGRISDNLAYAKWNLDKNYNAAEDYKEVIKIFEEDGDYFGLSTTYDHLIEYYKSNDPKTAYQYVQKKYDLTYKTNNTEGKLNALKSIITLKPNAKKIDEYIQLSDSLNYINSNTKYQFAKLEFDVDENREKITALTLQNTENKLRLEKTKISSIITIAILVIGLIIFTSYLYFIKEKQKKERLAAIYDTEVLLSQKLHDELANDLFNTLTLVESLEFERDAVKSKLLYNLNHIYSQTRSISRQNNTVDTLNFDKELDTMLATYKSSQANIITQGISNIKWNELEDQVKIVVYRVLMELMTNMKKHSNCSLVVIKFQIENHMLSINYIDNGNVDQVKVLNKSNGLKNVENRINTINGSINFNFSKGFKAFIKLPLNKN